MVIALGVTQWHPSRPAKSACCTEHAAVGCRKMLSKKHAMAMSCWGEGLILTRERVHLRCSAPLNYRSLPGDSCSLTSASISSQSLEYRLIDDAASGWNMSTAYHKLPGYWFWGGGRFSEIYWHRPSCRGEVAWVQCKNTQTKWNIIWEKQGTKHWLGDSMVGKHYPPRQIAQFSRSFQPNPGPVAGEHLLGVNSLSQLPQSQSCGEPCA